MAVATAPVPLISDGGGAALGTALTDLAIPPGLAASAVATASLDGGEEAVAESSSPSFLTPAVRGMLAVSLSAFLFGSNMTATKLVLAGGDGPSPAALCAARFAIAALCCAPALPTAVRAPALRARSLELGLYLSAGYITQAAGLAHTTASRSAFSAAFTVIVVPLFAALSGSSRGARSTWAAAAVAVAGVALLTNDGGAPPNVGDAACILSACLFGWHKYRAEAAADATPAHETSALVAGQLAVLATASALAATPDIAASLHAGGLAGAFADADTLPWPLLAYMGVFTTFLCLKLEAGALSSISASTAALLYAAEPVYGACIASFALGDTWTARGVAGAVLVVAASLAGTRAAAGGKHKLE
ncbi:MAG: EamA family transporter [Rhodoferax sp.]|nr:EamA family transporter [Rhodoferax sp.]